MASGLMKTHGAGTLRAGDDGSDVVLAGWVARRRDHGGVIFIDLRDASGVVQVVLNPEDTPAPEDVLHGLRLEFCRPNHCHSPSTGERTSMKESGSSIDTSTCVASVWPTT
jgi:aspartyl-tRNA synthetase